MPIILHTDRPCSTNTWRPTLSPGTWMNTRRTLWLSQSRTTGVWDVTDGVWDVTDGVWDVTDGVEVATHRPSAFVVGD